ncbi:MAG: hypothetical protein U5N53_00345 [Mycobacterium sp.]|nr:hypothetical protein [Mycobacterium sp.]
MAFLPPILDAIQEAVAGSRAAYLVVLGPLMALIASGYRRPPQGVSDSETDWIIALVLGGGTIILLELISRRLPTFSGLWNLQSIQAVVWLCSASTVVFSIRHTLRLYGVWLFAILGVSVTPYLLLNAKLGGSDTAAALLAVGLGAFALFSGLRFSLLRWRVSVTLASIGIAVTCVLALDHASLLLRVAVGTFVVPVGVFVAMQHCPDWLCVQDGKHVVRSTFPRRNVTSHVVLILLAVALLCLQLTRLEPAQVPPSAKADWVQKLGLLPIAEYPFITDYLGPRTTFVRYALPVAQGSPRVAVDVIESPTLAPLRDYGDVTWYPVTRPVNFEPVSVGGGLPEVRFGYTDRDAGIADNPDWYALTWIFETSPGFERVTMIVNQDLNSSTYPPEPQPITAIESLLRPLEWVLRQQPNPRDRVSPAVELYAENTVRKILVGASGRA